MKLRNVSSRNANWRDQSEKHKCRSAQQAGTTEKPDILWEALESHKVKGRDL